MIKVLIADDHAVVRDGLAALLNADLTIEVLGTAANGREAVKKTGKLKPNVVVMDIAMPELNGIEATVQIRQDYPATQVIILSMHDTSEHIYQALRAGAKGYLIKESAGKEVVEAVRKVNQGQQYLSQSIQEKLVEDYVKGGREAKEKSPLESLSAREREILQLVVEGKSSAEIADMIFISPKTVETYRSRLMQKLAVKDIPSLVKFAIKHGLTSLDSST
jgi:DNA-binding NarL/FixJ family response regulator